MRFLSFAVLGLGLLALGCANFPPCQAGCWDLTPRLPLRQPIVTMDLRGQDTARMLNALRSVFEQDGFTVRQGQLGDVAWGDLASDIEPAPSYVRAVKHRRPDARWLWGMYNYYVAPNRNETQDVLVAVKPWGQGQRLQVRSLRTVFNSDNAHPGNPGFWGPPPAEADDRIPDYESAGFRDRVQAAYDFAR